MERASNTWCRSESSRGRGVELAGSTLGDWVREGAALLEPLADAIFERAMESHSVLAPRLASDDMERFIYRELDAVALPHATFTPEAFGLVVRASEGYLRRARNLCVGPLLETVRDRTRTVDLKQF